MTILLLVLSFVCLILVGYFMAGVWKFIIEKDKSFLEMNMKLLIIISMLLGIVTLLLRYIYAN
jgi:succinate dehydrogenase/fumarate reductase cytochrome b subunit